MKIGIIGWRGMVGQVLLERMAQESDFGGLETTFFSTSQAGEPAPKVVGGGSLLADAYCLETLSQHEVLLSCQGGAYTAQVHGALRKNGWDGFWVDAASTLRMESDSLIALDPLNESLLLRGIKDGCKDFIGGNCTVSLMLMALGGLFSAGLVEWVTSMTYQAVSGAGAKAVLELGAQLDYLCEAAQGADGALGYSSRCGEAVKSPSFPTEQLGAPLAGNVLPWIDSAMPNGQTREEWKGAAETNKILGLEAQPVPIEGVCVRVPALRSHSQACTIKLNKSISEDEFIKICSASNEWVKVIPNTKEETLAGLTPAAVSGTLEVALGRVRQLAMGPDYFSVFTVGDQLLWGAAEPLRRMVQLLRVHAS